MDFDINNGDGAYPKLSLVNTKGDDGMSIEPVGSAPAPRIKRQRASGPTVEVNPETGEPLATTAKPAPVLKMPKGKIADYIDPEIVSFKPSEIELPTKEHGVLYDERINLPLDAAFLESLREHGQIDAGVVFPLANGKYLVIEGTRRQRHLAELKQPFKARKVRPEAGDLAAIAMQVITNEQRADDSLRVRGQKMKRALTAFGWDENDARAKPNKAAFESVAGLFGVTVQTVRNAVGLVTKADPSVLKAIDDGIIKETTALSIIKGEKEDQKKAVEKARAASVKLGDAKVASKGKTGGKPKAVTRAALEAGAKKGKPHAAFIAEMAEKATGMSSDATNILLWVAGELDAEGAAEAVKGFRKTWEQCENAPFELE